MASGVELHLVTDDAGVVRAADPGNYVPTCMGERDDALIGLDDTEALSPLRREGSSSEPEFETESRGF